MRINLVKIPGPHINKKSHRLIVEEKQFKKLIKKGYSKKTFNSELGVGHVIWQRSLHHYYPSELDREFLRRSKIMKTTAGRRNVLWRERVKVIEKYFPGIELSIDQGNYSFALDSLEKANKETYNLKEAIRKVIKHVRHGGGRRGLKINLVSNALEHKVSKILDELGLVYLPSYKIENRVYDFRIIGYKILIEVDGRYHTPEADLPKDKLAKRRGYLLIRIKEKDVRYVHSIKDTINKALRKKGSL